MAVRVYFVMALNREEIERRLEERRGQERQAFANFNAIHGAVQELESLLEQASEDVSDE